MNPNIFRALGGVIEVDGNYYRAYFPGKNGVVTADTEQETLDKYIQHILGIVPKKPDTIKYKDGLDLSDPDIENVEGWRLQGGTVKAVGGGMFVASMPDKSIIESGPTAEDAIATVIARVVENRAKYRKNLKSMKHLFAASADAEKYAK